MSEHKGELIIYQTEDGLTKIDVHMDNETVWLTRKQMAELFDRDISVIGRMSVMFLTKANCRKKAMCKKCTLQTQTSRLSSTAST